MAGAVISHAANEAVPTLVGIGLLIMASAILWFEGSEIDPHIVGEAHTLHATMLATLDPPKQPAPNDHWCIGCSPDPDNFTDQPCCGCERPRPTDGP